MPLSADARSSNTKSPAGTTSSRRTVLSLLPETAHSNGSYVEEHCRAPTVVTRVNVGAVIRRRFDWRDPLVDRRATHLRDQMSRRHSSYVDPQISHRIIP